MTDSRKHSVTIDDLLKLKRAEAPPPEFWAQFERELREKQLAAIVEKRPWWCAIPSLYVFVVRHRLSLAASASALTIGLVGFNVYQGFRPALEYSASDLQLAAAAPTASALPAVAVSMVAVNAPSAAVVATEPVASKARPAARLAAASSESVPAIPLLDDMPPSGATERFAALSRSMSGDLATSTLAAPAGARSLLVGTRDFGARLIPARAAVAEPLSDMQAPSEHRSRLLAEAYPTMVSSGELIAPPSERVLSSLSDDRLYSSADRLDLATERDAIKLSIRF
jgi:hypothetical protein